MEGIGLEKKKNTKMEDGLVHSAQKMCKNRMNEGGKVKKKKKSNKIKTKKTILQSSNETTVDYPIQERCFGFTVETERGRGGRQNLFALRLRTTRNPRGIQEKQTGPGASCQGGFWVA